MFIRSMTSDQARRYISQGAEGICTDFLTAEDLW